MGEIRWFFVPVLFFFCFFPDGSSMFSMGVPTKNHWFLLGSLIFAMSL